MRFLFIGSLVLAAPLLAAQQPIGRTSATEVQVSGAVDISHGETTLGNGSEITAGKQAVKIALTALSVNLLSIPGRLDGLLIIPRRLPYPAVERSSTALQHAR